MLRVVLSHSRKGYSEAVLRQDTETFLRVLENAIRSFGGVPLTFSAPRDDTARASCGNGAKSDFLSLYHSHESTITGHNITPRMAVYY